MSFRCAQASAYEACVRTRTPLDTSKTERCKKKAYLVSFKKLQGVRQIARLKQQRFLSFTFYITQRSYEKIIRIYSVPKIALYFYFIFINKKKHEWWNNRFSDVFTYRRNLKNSSLFFLIQDNIMFKINSLFFSFNFSY